MGNFLALAKAKGMASLVTTVSATGGGAYKFEDAFRKVTIPETLKPKVSWVERGALRQLLRASVGAHNGSTGRRF